MAFVTFWTVQCASSLPHALIIVTRVDVYNTMSQCPSHILRLTVTLTNSLNFSFCWEYDDTCFSHTVCYHLAAYTCISAVLSTGVIKIGVAN